MPKNIDIIRLIDFAKHFPDENSCRETFKKYIEQEGIVFKKCGNKTHYWKKKREQWECEKCTHRTTLKGTGNFTGINQKINNNVVKLIK